MTLAPTPTSHGVDYFDGMAWATPQHSKTAVDRAATTFMNPASTKTEREQAREVINNWRSSHSFPLNTMQVNLRHRAAQFDPDALVAQRLKRLPSIVRKLEDRPTMRFSRMQDIGGCRAVVRDLAAVEAVVEAHRSSRSPHALVREDNYIETPKDSGYRSRHMVYQYRSDTKQEYDGLSIEVQVRTGAQHAWATAVETVGTFTRQALKSSQGEGDWLRFFSLMGSAVAHIEGTPLVPGTPEDVDQLRDEIALLADGLGVRTRLEAFTSTLQFADRDSGFHASDKYCILELDVEPGNARLTVRGFADQVSATQYFSSVERLAEERPSIDVVLVSVGALSSLSRAYPNYYLDTENFRGLMDGFLAG